MKDPEDIKNMVTKHFSDIFSFSLVLIPLENEIPGHPILSDNENRILNVDLTNLEIWEIIKGIHPYKAPGPDGIQVVFYHKY